MLIFSLFLVGGCAADPVTQPAPVAQNQPAPVIQQTPPPPQAQVQSPQQPPRVQPQVRAQAPAPPPAVPDRNNPNTDPCATRMHDLCGPLLLYYGIYHKLPQSLDELKKLPSFENLEFVCPESKLPYIYTPTGVSVATGQNSSAASRTVIVLADPTPAHWGIRWGISVDEREPGKGIVAKVVVIPSAP